MLGCSSGHRFDVNRRGYASLLGGRSATTGDTAPMLDARDSVLDSGTYDPILDAVDAVIPSSPGGRIIDVGTGTGHYLERVLLSRPTWRALALDRSPAAVVRSSRRTGADGLVADVWRPWPVRDAVATVILDVFAPRNVEEFHRVLAPGGSLVVVVPQDDHLGQLQESGMALGVAPGKATGLVDELWPWFEHDQSREVRYSVAPEPGFVDAVIGMGPSAHHEGTRTRGAERPHEITVALTVLRFRRRRRALTA